MAEEIFRNVQIEEITNRVVFQPLSTWAAPLLVKLGISANATSLLGMASGLFGAWCYFHYALSVWYTIAGFAAMCLWHVLDGADGQVARLTNTQSQVGKVIDGICDYVVFIAAYLVLAHQLEVKYPNMAWPLVITAGAMHIVQASAHEAQRQMFDFWALGKQSARLGVGVRAAPRSVSTVIIYVYEMIQLRFSGIDPKFLNWLDRNLPSDPAVRQAYAITFAPMVRRWWSILSANYRTYGIFLCCLIKRPEVYFIIEVVGLSLVHVTLVRLQYSANRKFVTSQDQQAGQF